MKQLIDKLCCINISQHLSENQCTEYIFGCSQNSAISFVIALPGKNLQGSGAIMRMLCIVLRCSEKALRMLWKILRMP